MPEWKIRRYVYIYIYVYIPGSSRYVKFLPFGRFLGEFRHKFYTLGRCRYIYIYMICMWRISLVEEMNEVSGFTDHVEKVKT